MAQRKRDACDDLRDLIGEWIASNREYVNGSHGRGRFLSLLCGHVAATAVATQGGTASADALNVLGSKVFYGALRNATVYLRDAAGEPRVEETN